MGGVLAVNRVRQEILDGGQHGIGIACDNVPRALAAEHRTGGFEPGRDRERREAGQDGKDVLDRRQRLSGRVKRVTRVELLSSMVDAEDAPVLQP